MPKKKEVSKSKRSSTRKRTSKKTTHRTTKRKSAKKTAKRKAAKKPAKRTAKKTKKVTVKRSKSAVAKSGEPSSPQQRLIDKYEFSAKDMPITIRIYHQVGEFVPIYEVSIQAISPTTEMILEKIRKELIKQVNLGMIDITDAKDQNIIEEKFSETIRVLIEKYFPDIDEQTMGFLTTYLIQKSLGMGNIELLMADKLLEEICINQADEPVWIYHKTHGWLKTNIRLSNEEQIKHYASMIGRKVGRQITILDPLLDAHLDEGDRVNATLKPISSRGNTITIRKFSRDPFTITHFIKFKTMSIDAASLIWHAMQYELSAIIAGGTASGKTSTLNVLASFFPPNQRIISIEDTRELRLPKFLHWVPMSTRLPNSEGKGEISMGDLLVNALRQRPDRVLVGEVRRKREAETLFEAIHTGHSVYATFHANNSQEAVDRLTNPPIDVPKTMLPAISLIITQFRNRRTGLRRTFQIAEILRDATPNVILQYDAKADVLQRKERSIALMDTLHLYTGMTTKETEYALREKQEVLKYLVKNNIETIDSVGRVMAEFYVDKQNLMRQVRANKPLR